MRKFWTNEEEIIIKTKKRPDESWEEFALRELPHRTITAVRGYATQKLNINNKGFVRRTHFFNKDVWKTFTPESCYWAGWLASDGYIRRYGCSANGYAVGIDLKSTESYQLLKFKEFCGYTGDLQKVRHVKHKNSITQSININVGMDWVDDLRENFGVVPAKSRILQPPNIKDEYLVQCYLLGILDGDGCTHLDNRGKISLSLTSASMDFANWVMSKLNEIAKNSSRVNKERKVVICGGYPRVGVYGNAACALIDYFRQFPLPKLDRKWNNPKILEYIELQKQKYPDKFLTLEIPTEFQP